MKFIPLLMLTGVALASCNKESNENGPSSGVDKAFLSISLINSGSTATYAESVTTTNGTEAESKATQVVVVAFNNNNGKVGVYSLTSEEQGTIGQGSAQAASGEAFQVAKDTKKLFILVNPTNEVLAAVNAASTYAAMNQVINNASVKALTVDNNFMMASAGITTGELGGLTVVSPTIATSESATDIKAAQTAAKNSPVNINVDRIMAKVMLDNNADMTVNNGTAALDGWKANTTNTKYLIYAQLSTNYDYQLTNHYYRIDPNFTDVGNPTFMTEFNWIKNTDNIAANKDNFTWNNLSSSEYVLENTVGADAQNYNNITKIIIKGVFAPAGVTLRNSWFRVNGVVKTFEQLQADYATAKQNNVQATIDGFDAFAVALLGTGKTFADIPNISTLDNIENGGYKAACATGYMIEYFQKGVCYYDVNIKHDYTVLAKMEGRWGVVRNNYYIIKVTNISKPGKPYIPDPTDPKIVDPENPDPVNPKPADESSAFISVALSVNPWTVWTQEHQL